MMYYVLKDVDSRKSHFKGTQRLCGRDVLTIQYDEDELKLSYGVIDLQHRKICGPIKKKFTVNDSGFTIIIDDASGEDTCSELND